MSEVRYAIRQLLKSPGFTLVAILGLALGIGANVAFFSVVNSVFLRPLPYREPDRLVRLSSTNEAQNLTRGGFSYSRYVAVQEQQQVFSDLALSIGNAFTLTGGGFFFQAVARLRPGVSPTQAQEAMNVVAANYRAAYSANVDAPSRIDVVPLLDDAVGQQRQSYLLLFGAVGCVLLIACANIANLVLARFAGRRREIAARFALGATRFDVIRQLVTESMLLAVLGGAVGLLFAQWALATLVAFAADFIPRAIEIRIDRLPLGFALAVSLVTGLAIGLLPAWQAASVNVQLSLEVAGRGSVGSGGRLRSGLLVAEVSLSLVLLIAVGLLLTSFARLQQVKPGSQ